MAYKFDVKNRRGGIGNLFSGLIELIAFFAGDPAAYLDIDAVLTSGWVKTNEFSRVVGAAFSDVAGSMVVQFSTTGQGNEVDAQSAAVVVPAGGQGVPFSIEVQAEYMRIVYTNGGAAQTAFRLKAYGRCLS